MRTNDLGPVLSRLFSELVEGVGPNDVAFMLNPGDAGLLRSLDTLTPQAASRAVNGGATIAAHAQHLRYGLSLMNRWAAERGNPFADARWGDAWRVTTVDEAQWAEIRKGLADEAREWLDAVRAPKEVIEVELSGMIASIAHLAYHLGAIRQIDRHIRGPREGQ